MKGCWTYLKNMSVRPQQQRRFNQHLASFLFLLVGAEEEGGFFPPKCTLYKIINWN